MYSVEELLPPALRWLSLTLVAACLSGCVTYGLLQETSASPKVNIDRHQESLALEIDPSIPNEFLIPEGPRTREVRVSSWRNSLQNGFRRGYGPFFPLVDRDSALTIRIIRAEPSLGMTGVRQGPTTVSTTRIGNSTRASATSSVMPTFGCTIVYQAQLVDAQGTVVRKDYAEASSKAPGGIREMCTGALESMYEQIAIQFFPVELNAERPGTPP
jgi:hypothetical protein